MKDYTGKSLIIVAGGLLQLEAVRIAKELGLRVIVTDRNPNCPCAKLADVFVELDTKDLDGHVALAKTVNGLAGIFVEGASVEMTAAAVSEACGLPGLDLETAKTIADKAKMRLMLNAANVSRVEMDYFIDTQFDLAKGFADKHYPVVVKAVDSSGSRGLTKCYRAEEFAPEVFNRASKASSNGMVLVEELFNPDPHENIAEMSCETVWHEGKGYWLSAVDRAFLPDERWAIESDVYAPALHPDKKMQEVIDMCLAAGKALGMTTGIFKCDVMFTDKGAKILETTARLSGGFDSQYLTPLAYGADYIRGAMLLALGEPIHWEYFHPKWHRHAVAKWLFPEPGTITSIKIDNEVVEAWGGKVFTRAQVGDVIPERTTCVDRTAVVIAGGDSRRDADEQARLIEPWVQINTENHTGHA